MSLVSERCEKCKYKGEVFFGELCCDYILIKSEKRGCPAGDECDKFEENEYWNIMNVKLSRNLIKKANL